VEIGQLANCQP